MPSIKPPPLLLGKGSTTIAGFLPPRQLRLPPNPYYQRIISNFGKFCGRDPVGLRSISSFDESLTIPNALIPLPAVRLQRKSLSPFLPAGIITDLVLTTATYMATTKKTDKMPVSTIKRLDDFISSACKMVFSVIQWIYLMMVHILKTVTLGSIVLTMQNGNFRI